MEGWFIENLYKLQFEDDAILNFLQIFINVKYFFKKTRLSDN
jgi:hypothetical protein